MTPTIDPYSSHLPLLVAACEVARRSHTADDELTLVELGSGLYSTPVLRAWGLAGGHRVITIDNDPKWLGRVRGTPNPRHRVIVLDDWGDLDRYGSELTCGVAFVDMAPASARGAAIHVMRRWATIIVVHDTETEQRHNYPGVAEAIASFTWAITDRRRGPWVTAVSDSIDLTHVLREAIL